jgi:acetyltransferase-like isoleucine patch superfamily enzyme
LCELRPLKTYIGRQAAGPLRYLLEQLLFALAGWVPTVIGLGLRAVLYRLIMRLDGVAVIETGVRLRFASLIHLGHNVYLDQSVYLHACPQGIAIGDNSLVMHGSVLHVYNFRDLPHAFIHC